tara:strand:- start:94 stop:243 length:150 start_codon:yes stop_codon:yes gene_type:complete
VVVPSECLVGGYFVPEVIVRSHEWLTKIADYASIVFSAFFLVITMAVNF